MRLYMSEMFFLIAYYSSLRKGTNQQIFQGENQSTTIFTAYAKVRFY